MGNKDKINKIFGILSLEMMAIIISGYLTGIDSLFGFPNVMLLYALMPLVLIWFGTRKNACGSCNRSCSILEKKEN